MSKELLFSVTRKDLEIDYFSGTGAGGQYRNKHQNCVRIRHPESGASTTGQSNRNRQANIREAFQGLVRSTRFRLWHARKVAKCLTNESLDDKVDKAMDDRNIKFERRGSDGKWEDTTYDNGQQKIKSQSN